MNAKMNSNALERPDGLPVVEWKPNIGDVQSCIVGGWQVDLWPSQTLWWVRAIYRSSASPMFYESFKSPDEASAKAEALRLTQAAVRTAAEAWGVWPPSFDRKATTNEQ